MTVEQIEYQAAIKAVVVVARVIGQHDIPELLRSIEHADAFGCFVDPTLWINNRDKMLQDKQVLEAALPLWHLAKKFEAMQAAEAAPA